MKHCERNEKIFQLRNEELKTLQAIANEFGMTRERVRQIVRTERKKRYRLAYLGKYPEKIDFIGFLPWNTRLSNVINNYCLRKFGSYAYDTPIKVFVEAATFEDLFSEPNMGKKSMAVLLEVLADHGYKNLPHLRPSGDRENYRASEQSG